MRRSSGWSWRLESLKSQTENLISRLELVKDIDPFNKKLLNDCHDTLKTLLTEIERLQYHNNNLMNVIYQNHHDMEN